MIKTIGIPLLILASTALYATSSVLAEVKNGGRLEKDDTVTESQRKTQKSGCCAMHGEKCLCKKGKVKCCDGKVSPTCGC